jgi:hypothetical protein
MLNYIRIIEEFVMSIHMLHGLVYDLFDIT